MFVLVQSMDHFYSIKKKKKGKVKKFIFNNFLNFQEGRGKLNILKTSLVYVSGNMIFCYRNGS